MRLFFIFFATIILAQPCSAEPPSRSVRVGDIATVEGVRDNPLIGYGLVVGLNGTGDRRQTVFTTQMLANVLDRMGMQIPASAVRVNNVAAVFVTATLPPFARPGMQIDVTVSSVGDAKSLEGGLLLLTPLRGPDGQTYAAAQGALTVGGYAAGIAGNTKQANHPTVARVPSGALVERAIPLDLQAMGLLALQLREGDYAAARDIAAAVNRELGRDAAFARDGRRIEIDTRASGLNNNAELLARVEAITVTLHPRAKVVVNERTGTIVLGRDVRLGPVSILHGNLSIEISTEFKVSQPTEFSKGETTVVPQPSVRVNEQAARKIELAEGASVEQLVNGLQAMGATARDVISILQALKAAGALQADLEVL